MRIFHTSDLHLGKSLYDFSLLEDQQYLLDQLISIIGGGGIDAVVIAGDIYDRPVPSAHAVQLYDYFLSQVVGHMGIPVLAIAGNHDSASRLEFGSSLYAASGYHVSGQVREEMHRVTLEDTDGPVDFWLMPYLHPADVRTLYSEETVHTFDDAWRVWIAANKPRMDLDRRNVAVAHGFFSPIGTREDKPVLTSDSEVNIGGMDIADSGYFAPFDYTALGHLHAPQRAGGETVRYSGSPLKYSLSEERQHKSYTIVDLGPKSAVTATPLPVEPMRDVRTIAGALDQLLEPSFHRTDRFDDYVFAVLSDGDALYPMQKLRKLFPRLLGLRLTGEDDSAAREITIGGSMPRLSPEEMFQRFYRDAKGYDMPEESKAFLMDTLEEAGKELIPG